MYVFFCTCVCTCPYTCLHTCLCTCLCICPMRKPLVPLICIYLESVGSGHFCAVHSTRRPTHFCLFPAGGPSDIVRRVQLHRMQHWSDVPCNLHARLYACLYACLCTCPHICRCACPPHTSPHMFNGQRVLCHPHMYWECLCTCLCISLHLHTCLYTCLYTRICTNTSMRMTIHKSISMSMHTTTTCRCTHNGQMWCLYAAYTHV